MKLEFSGNRALIVGGTCDLAIVLAELMIQEGLFPFLSARNEGGMERIGENLKAYDGKYEIVILDFKNPLKISSVFEGIGEDLDYLVDFAHGDFERLIAAANTKDVYCYFEENISYRAEILKRAGRAMLREKKGRLVFVSSAAARKPNPGQGFYAAAKLASEALYRNMGLELGKKGITTVTLRPGYIQSGRGETYLKPVNGEAIKKIPIKRALHPTEVAETVLFFLSESARGFNATEISLDGGLTAGK